MITRKLRHIVSTCFPHNNRRTVCPPGPIPTGVHAPIIVSSLMRSGTHLAIDLLLNNLWSYRNNPLYIDFDRLALDTPDPERIKTAGSCIIKTHVQQCAFDEKTRDLLKSIASKGLVVIPTRDLAATHSSLKKWNQSFSLEKLKRDHSEHLDFWKEFFPIVVDFKDLLDPARAGLFLRDVRQRLDLPDDESPADVITASGLELRIFWSKLHTRLVGSDAGLINTTIGFKT